MAGGVESPRQVGHQGEAFAGDEVILEVGFHSGALAREVLLAQFHIVFGTFD